MAAGAGAAMTVHFFKRLRHPCTGRQRDLPLQTERAIWRTAGPNPLVPCTEPCRYSSGSSEIIVAVCQPFLPFRFFCAFHRTFTFVKTMSTSSRRYLVARSPVVPIPVTFFISPGHSSNTSCVSSRRARVFSSWNSRFWS